MELNRTSCTHAGASRRSSSCPDVAERVDLYLEHAEARRPSRSTRKRPRCNGKNLRGARPPRPRRSSHPTNRFHDLRAVPPGPTSRSTCSGACGSRYTVFRRPARFDHRSRQPHETSGELDALSYGGPAAHEAAGTCQVENDVRRARARRARRAHHPGQLAFPGAVLAPDAHLPPRRPRVWRGSSTTTAARCRRSRNFRGRPHRRVRGRSCAASPGQQLSVQGRSVDLGAPSLERYGGPYADAPSRSSPTTPTSWRVAAGFLARQGSATCASLAERIVSGEPRLRAAAQPVGRRT